MTKRLLIFINILLILTLFVSCVSKPNGFKYKATEEQKAQLATKKIAFTSKRDGNYEIYVMNADGSEQINLTNNPADDGLLGWSLDGKKIVFESNRDGQFGAIYVMNADGSEQTKLINIPCDFWNYTLSSDHKKIAFFCKELGRNFEIYVMNADGSEQKILFNDEWSTLRSNCISWSLDCTKIAFSYNDEIFVINIDGTGLKNLTSSQVHEYSPTWSLDGRQIFFIREERQRGDSIFNICVMNTDGSEQTVLANDVERYSLLPDRKKIAFRSKSDFNPGLYIMNTDGSEKTFLTAAYIYPKWSSDGTKIVYSKDVSFFNIFDSPTSYEIFIMNADGSERNRLTKNSADDGNPNFQP